ncbi:TRP-domain-containing protein [Aureobasidium pullulans]|uniref:TRP-domain-containing protein n=1 Tax=Aureobasidium pullulans TaxID=5580 RepID=A0A4S9C633_AURPU|nr:TRP-domain-containing protein [Aureobasidium pullulans]
MWSSGISWGLSLVLLSALPARVLGGDILSTQGYSLCSSDPTIQVQALDIQYDRSTNQVVFNVAGSSSISQKVKAKILVTAYGRQVYEKSFNPCDSDTYVEQLCPVPAGSFAAQGNQSIPAEYASQIPSIAFNVPDLDGVAKLELFADDDDTKDLACVQSTVSNGKSMNVQAVTYVAAGMAGAALGISALGAVVGGFHVGGASPSPTFGETFGWFQGIATNGMLSVTYPTIYSSFAKNFGFSTGLIPWGRMQQTIDSFRSMTGGDLTTDSYAFLQNSTLVDASTGSNLTKRGLDTMFLYARDFSASVNGTTAISQGSSDSGNSTTTESKPMHYVHGIQAYVEKLSIPQGNTFMTILLFFAIVIAVITVGILLTKVILEALALMGNLPKSMNSFRKRYWWRLAKTITNLVMLAYGVWTLYCVYQFTNGDSWAAKVLAGVTWAIFTLILGFFAFTIWHKAKKYQKMDGDASMLYEHKETWVRYAFLYENFKKGYWWLFIPTIVYAFAKNAMIAGANGHGLIQTIGQIAIECLLLILLVWSRPYTLKSGNVINITIQVVRVISVICVLVFVEELGISQTTKTVTGLVLIVVQSVLTGVLAILIAVNAIITCVRANPHRKRRKEAEKLKNRDLDDLTPLDARNSLLMDPTQLTEYKGAGSQVSEYKKAPLVSPSLTSTTTKSKIAYDPLSKRSESPYGYGGRPELSRDESQQNLVSGAASMGGRDRSNSPARQPRLPDVEFGQFDFRHQH